MNSIVIYHTISGNTKKIAEAIYTGMSRASLTGEQCEIARIRDIDAQDLANYDLIGLGGPVFHQQEMSNITNFIEYTMESVDGKHGFAFCTHGSLPGNFLSRVVTKMMQRGMTIIGWNNWFGAVYHACIRFPSYTAGHPDAIDLEEAEDFGRQMVEHSQRIYSGETQLIPTFPRGSEYEKIYLSSPPEGARLGQRRFANSHSLKFTVNLEKCKFPKCTICIDNCPAGCIEYSESPLARNIYCDRYIDRCWLCEMICPHGAIEYDYRPFQAVHWQPRGAPPRRPEPLAVYEARGSFRRLISVEDEGWDTPFWTLKKPRLSHKIQNKPKIGKNKQ